MNLQSQSAKKQLAREVGYHCACASPGFWQQHPACARINIGCIYTRTSHGCHLSVDAPVGVIDGLHDLFLGSLTGAYFVPV